MFSDHPENKKSLKSNITNIKQITFLQNPYKRATYKPRLTRCQRTKMYTVESHLYLNGH